GAGAGGPPGPGSGAEDDRGARGNKRRGAAPGGTGVKPAKRTFSSESEELKWREQDLIEREARLSRSEGFL
ncbi:MAG TPA: hypothetical protein DEB06_10895, partial [Phycisphaerales bacterium]|nr:hypothetical protein [Phycisphaerales bacterium]